MTLTPPCIIRCKIIKQRWSWSNFPYNGLHFLSQDSTFHSNHLFFFTFTLDGARSLFTLCLAKFNLFLDNLTPVFFNFKACWKPATLILKLESWETSFEVRLATAFDYVSVLLHTLSEVEKSPVPSFRKWGISLKPLWIILTTVRIRKFSTVPTRGFAIVSTREFLFVTTRIISFFASLRRSVSRTGKSLHANKTLFEKYDNSQLIILHATVFLLACSVRRITLVFKLFAPYPTYSTRRHVLHIKSFTAQAVRKAFSRRVFRNTDRKLSRIISGFNIKGK